MEDGNRLFWVVLAFLLGIIAGNLFFENFWFQGGTLLILFFIYLIFRVGILNGLECFLIVIIGIVRVYFVLVEPVKLLDFGAKYGVKGYVSEEVDIRDDKIKYTLQASEVCSGGKCENFDGRFLINAERYPVFEFGDELMVFGKLQEPFVQDGFDYGKYLKLHSVSYWLKGEAIERIGVWDLSVWQRIKKALYYSKAVLENKIDEFFVDPYGNFLKGLLTGSRRGINVDITQHFQLVGLSHVVAISGYNITLLIVVVGAGFAFLKKNLRILFSAIFIFTFVLLVGASAAVVRAGVMGGISLLALYFGRSYLAFRGLFLAAGIMCLINPLTLIYDAGFQLSFLATLGIVGFSPYLECFTLRIEGSFWRMLIFEAVGSTLISTLMTLPILISSFGGLSLAAPLANLLVLPLVSFVMFLGFAAISLGTIVPVVGQLFAFLAYVLMSYMFFVARVLADFDFSFLALDKLNFYFCLLYYFVLMVVVLKKNLT